MQIDTDYSNPSQIYFGTGQDDDRRTLAVANQFVSRALGFDFPGLFADPEVVEALMSTGMSRKDAMRLAHVVSPEEARDPEFLDDIKWNLKGGWSASESVLRARYEGVASETELVDPDFLKALARAEGDHLGDLPGTVHQVRAERTAERMGEALDLDSALKLDDETLLKYEALVKAGMKPEDVLKVGGSVTAMESKNPAFLYKLEEFLSQGSSPDDAILQARFFGRATDEELHDPDFLKALGEAGQHGHGDNIDDTVQYARASLLVRRLDGAIDLDSAMKLPPEVLAGLAKMKPEEIKQLLALGVGIEDIASLPAPLRQGLLDADPVVAKALIGAGMSLEDVATYAPTVGRLELTPTFLEDLHDALRTSSPHGSVFFRADAGEAILKARFKGYATPEELADPVFLKYLGEAGEHGMGGSQADALKYAREQYAANSHPTEAEPASEPVPKTRD